MGRYLMITTAKISAIGNSAGNCESCTDANAFSENAVEEMVGLMEPNSDDNVPPGARLPPANKATLYCTRASFGPQRTR